MPSKIEKIMHFSNLFRDEEWYALVMTEAGKCLEIRFLDVQPPDPKQGVWVEAPEWLATGKV